MLDQVTYQVVHGGLRALAQEMKIAVMRTAYSPIVASGGDMSAGLANVGGEVVAQGQDIPAQLGALPSSFRAMLDGWLGRLEPGDVLIGNDPYVCGSNHINDVCLVMPAYTADPDPELLGYVCTRTHWMDIGGATPGSFNARVLDMYAEGLRIPTVLAYRRYEPVRDIWEIIFANVRGRTEREWDLRAGFAGCATAERGLRRLAGKYGADVVREAMQRGLDDTESRVRQRISALPDGRYTAVDWFEGDGWTDEPIRLEITIEIDGSDVTMDWSGTAPQVRGGVNLPMSSTIGVGIYALKAALAPDVVPNAGLWAPLRVTAPEGCFVNPRPPAPNQASAAETIQRCADLLLTCLAQVVPRQVMAGTHASATVLMLEGRDPVPWRREILKRERSVFMDNSPGGMGGRISGDGVSGIKVHTGNARVPSIEAAEFALPVRALRWERVEDTGGPGWRRGGCGVAREWEMLDDDVSFTLMSERAHVPAVGLLGGKAASTARFVVNDGAEGQTVLPSKAPPTMLKRGDRFLLQSAGGGGYGAPAEREIDRVVADVLDGYVSVQQAQEQYAVVLDEHGAVDDGRTGELRRAPPAPPPPPPPPPPWSGGRGVTVTSAPDGADGAVPDDLRDMVGRRFAQASGADPVSRAAVRQLLEAMNWDWPLEPGHDPSTGPVPLSTYLTFAMPAYRAPGEQLRLGRLPPLPYHLVPMEGARTMGTVVSVSAAGPMRYGDTLSSDWYVTGVRPARTRVGSGVFVEFEVHFYDQSGRPVAVERTTVLNFDPVGSIAPDTPGRAAGDTWSADPADSPSFDRRNPSVGHRLAPVRLEMTLQRLVMLASANRDFAPIHHDPSAAAEIGADQPVVNTMFLLSFVERLLTENAGPGARAVQLGPLRLHRPTAAGATLVVTGVVSSVAEVEDGREVGVDVVIGTSERGPTVTGSGAVKVPTASGAASLPDEHPAG